MPARRDLLILAGAGAAAAAAGLLLGPLVLQSTSGAAELLAARYPDASGRTRQIIEWKGTILVVNFWATWCAPCREEIPLLARFRAENAAKGVEVVGIGMDSAAKLLSYAKETAIPYPILLADGSAIGIMRALGNSSGALPYTVVLDRSGVIAYRKLGAVRSGELEKVVAGIVQ